LVCLHQALKRRSRTVSDLKDESGGRAAIVSQNASAASLVEGVRGYAAKTLHGSNVGSDVALSVVSLYADDLAACGYQLHERVCSGFVSETYRATRSPEQRRDVISLSQSRTAEDRTDELSVWLTHH